MRPDLGCNTKERVTLKVEVPAAPENKTDAPRKLEYTLEPGEVSETVIVSAEAPPLETANSTLGQVVTTRSIVSLPLNIRDPFALAQVARRLCPPAG